MPKTTAQRTKEYMQRRYEEIEQMEKIPCACGCGTMIAPFTRGLKPAQFAHGHNGRGNKYRQGKPSWNKGLKLPPEEIKQRTATRRAKNGGKYQVKSGWTHTDETRKRMSAVNSRPGEKNPFYGKSHTEHTRRLVSERLSGEKHPAWNGGTSTLPYGPGFTRKFKRLIRERDNYTCQRCGVTQEEYGATLEVHHLDHDKFNNDPTNLVTACHKCNVWASFHRDEPFRMRVSC